MVVRTPPKESTGLGNNGSLQSSRTNLSESVKPEDIHQVKNETIDSGKSGEVDACMEDSGHVSVAVLAINSLLQQFASVKVRGDFLNGRFYTSPNPDLLPMIDRLRLVLSPRWIGGGFHKNTPRMKVALDHCRLLLDQSPEMFTLTSDDGSNLTYAEWRAHLELLSKDRYWREVPPGERCGHLFNKEDYEATASVRDVPDTESYVKRIDCKTNLKGNNPNKQRASKKIEEIAVSSGSSASDEGTESSRSSSTNSSSSSSSYGRSRRRKRNPKRSVVTPAIFEMDGRTTLADFLEVFEEYFKKKYAGNSYDQTQVLSEFLRGELLKIYEIRGGRRLKYRRMKEELLRYYKDQKIGSKTYWRKQLSQLVPESDEAYDLYGMRLAEAAKLAYPNDKKESASQLRKSFIKCLPPYIATKIMDAERASNAATGSHKYLPFTSVMRMAKDLQNSGVKPRTVMWTSSSNSQQNLNRDKQVNSRTYTSRKHQQSPPHSPRRAPSTQNRPFTNGCAYCHRPNHSAANCWRAAKLCLICGGNHRIENCDKYDPNFQSRSQSRQSKSQSRSFGVGGAQKHRQRSPLNE